MSETTAERTESTPSSDGAGSTDADGAGDAATGRDETSSPIDSRARWRRPLADEDDEDEQDDARVLVITGLSHKNERHYGPLADVAGKTTLVCLEPERAIDDAEYVQVPEIGPRLLRVLLLFFVALYEGYRNEYDAVASISLLPYGLYALALKAVYGYPAHLGIIGIDLDHHARQWYGAGPRWAFRQFDAISVPGSAHARKLVRMGVPEERIEILTNAIDVDTYHPIPADIDAEYDFVWLGRFSAEKDPLLFVRALAQLEADGREFQAAMVGTGSDRTDVIDEIAAHGLEDRIALPGWVDDPLSYYRRSNTFVLTSRRDALPLALLEAMASGLAPIVPRVGSVPDVVTDGENGIVVPDRTPAAFARAMGRCLDDPDYRADLADAAPAVRDEFGMDEAGDDWRRILSTLEG
ncbi:glycosyltransferase [Halopiger aswanensis]|uniref:Glycosyltransferase involved in cell wall biosynthesis n=1 Tax=Halopiger aswanensis TaxID=148449 RepID=A0A3R7KMN4_9EURY|nr:glycosyltransferase [Halopiger aswanensis]RKD97404.1 glycosyltransferase involved in cell wall biosynthesis [Halopiger aswanensis]